METAKITITINMSKADYDRLKSQNGGEYVVKSLKTEFGDTK